VREAVRHSAFLALANLALGLVWSIVIVYAVRDLGRTGAAVGVALSLGQLGGFAGTALASRLANVAGVGRVVVAALFLFGRERFSWRARRHRRPSCFSCSA
jgi:NhaP-type Na+/H+ or K+/H+ antiporter